MRDIESLCEEAGLRKPVALNGREDLRRKPSERFQAFKARSLY